MSNIDLKLLERLPPRVDNSGGPPHDGDMEARIQKLEEFAADAKERLVKIEARLEQTATKSDLAEVRADLHKMDSSIKTWTLATMITIIGTMLAAIFGISQVFKSSAQPPQASAVQPIVIQMPSAPAAPTQPVK